MARRFAVIIANASAWIFSLGFLICQPALADSVSAGNPVLAPLKWEGLYKFRKPDGLYHCTAQFVTQNVIMLAAHCLRDVNTGTFYDPDNTKSIFYLQYQNDDYSKAYRPICSTTYNGYTVPLRDGEDPGKPETMSQQRQAEYEAAYDQHWQYDYGFVLLDGDSITGHYNYKLNAFANYATSTGYPGEMMSGEVVQYVSGDVIKTSDMFTRKGETNVQVLWHGNAGFTGGSSGGGWVANFSHDESPGTNILVGLNSFGVDNRPGASFGPMFNDNFQRLLTHAENGCRG